MNEDGNRINEEDNKPLSLQKLAFMASFILILILTFGLFSNNTRTYVGMLIIGSIVVALVSNMLNRHKALKIYTYVVLLNLCINIVIFNYISLLAYASKVRGIIPLPLSIYLEVQTRNGIKSLIELDWGQIFLIISIVLLRKMVMIIKSLRIENKVRIIEEA
ncbi:hypothetical protein DRN86_01030 [Candidatus Geothermarchaeota archaeon]|nr:MAG: hypothetical protein DRN86_01030 [Candidatus Geothermarchaeota archaeon]